MIFIAIDLIKGQQQYFPIFAAFNKKKISRFFDDRDAEIRQGHQLIYRLIYRPLSERMIAVCHELVC